MGVRASLQAELSHAIRCHAVPPEVPGLGSEGELSDFRRGQQPTLVPGTLGCPDVAAYVLPVGYPRVRIGG